MYAPLVLGAHTTPTVAASHHCIADSVPVIGAAALQLANQRIPVPCDTRAVSVLDDFGLFLDFGDDFLRRKHQLGIAR